MLTIHRSGSPLGVVPHAISWHWIAARDHRRARQPAPVVDARREPSRARARSGRAASTPAPSRRPRGGRRRAARPMAWSNRRKEKVSLLVGHPDGDHLPGLVRRDEQRAAAPRRGAREGRCCAGTGPRWRPRSVDAAVSSAAVTAASRCSAGSRSWSAPPHDVNVNFAPTSTCPVRRSVRFAARVSSRVTLSSTVSGPADLPLERSDPALAGRRDLDRPGPLERGPTRAACRSRR